MNLKLVKSKKGEEQSVAGPMQKILNIVLYFLLGGIIIYIIIFKIFKPILGQG